MRGRPDLGDFEVGAIYRHDHSGELAEFIGTAFMPELDGEDVGVFRWMAGGCVVGTRQGYESGDTFTLYGDTVIEELELDT